MRLIVNSLPPSNDLRPCKIKIISEALLTLAYQHSSFPFHHPAPKFIFEMWQKALCSHGTYLSSQSFRFVLKIGSYTLALSCANKKHETNLPGAVCMTNPPLCITSSPKSIVRTIQIDGWTRVAP